MGTVCNRQPPIVSQSKAIPFVLGLIAAFCLICFTDAVASPQLQGVLKQYLKENYPWPDVEIKALLFSEDPPERKPESILVEKGMPNRTVFVIQYSNGRRITATAMVKAFDWVIKTRRAYRKGYVLQDDDTYTTLMDIARIPKGAVRDAEQVTGSTLTRSVIANMPVLADMVSSTQRIKRGQRVMIIAESGGVSIVAKGVTKENAYVGDEVKVLNIDSKKVITGRLISEDTVKVVF